MKKILLIFALILCCRGAHGLGIVNNSGNTAADSMSLPFYVLDSSGNMTVTNTNDSLFLIVFYPGGAEAFRDTVAHGSSLITTVTAASYSVYNWKVAVADIDGSGKDGLYSYIIFVKDHSGAALATPHKGYFQLYQTSDFNTWADSIIARIGNLLAPTIAGRTLDVTSAGNAGIDWGNIENATTPNTRPQVDVQAVNASTAAADNLAEAADGDAVSGDVRIRLADTSAVVSGGWIDSNRTEQGGIAGANRIWNVYVYDTSGTDTPIPGANVDVQLTDGTVKSRGNTDASGLVTFTVTDGDWQLVSFETGYVLNNLSKTILANSTDTVKGFEIQIGAPSSSALCRVHGYVYSIGAVPEEGAGVAAYLPAGVARSGNLIISPFSVSTTTDSLGYFFLDLIRSDSLVPSGTMYDFVINRKDGTIVHKRLSVPDQSSWLLEW